MKHLIMFAALIVCVMLLSSQYSYAQTYERGQVVGITFDIKYPNGQTKTVSLGSEHINNLGGISFGFDLGTEDLLKWNISSRDWKENPTMILYYPGENGARYRSTPYCRWKWHLNDWEQHD